MSKVSKEASQSKKLICRACKRSFCAVRRADGSWRTRFPGNLPPADCSEHIDSGLCRWEVIRRRQQLWNKIAPAFKGKPAAFLTAVPPHRIVPFDKLSELKLEDEKRAIQRVLAKVLPEGTAAIAVFDISLDDDQTGEQRDRVWVPHFHILVAGITAAELRKICKGLYKRTEKVKRPVLIVDAPTPMNAIAHSPEHVDDVGADTAIRKTVGPGKKMAGGKGQEKESEPS